VILGTSSIGLKGRQELCNCISHTICRSSEACSFNWTFSWTTLSWVSQKLLSLSSNWWFSFLSQTTCDQSSSSCFCFLIRDRRADSRFDTILRCFLSLIRPRFCSSASSEVELLLMHEDGGLKSWRIWIWFWLKPYSWLESFGCWGVWMVFWIML